MWGRTIPYNDDVTIRNFWYEMQGESDELLSSGTNDKVITAYSPLNEAT